MPLFNRTKTPQKRLILLVLLLLYLASLLVGVGVGANRYTAGQVLSGLLNPNSGNLYTIISGVRLPRVLVASLVGVCLSLSGCILQGVMRNDLASPSTIGVTAGASFAGYLLLVAMPHMAHLLPIGAFAGAFATTLLIYALSNQDGVNPARMILSGLAVSAMLGAFNDIIRLFWSENLAGATGFLVGGLGGATWRQLWGILPYALAGLAACLLLPRRLNLLMLGDEVAESLGLHTEAFRLLLITISSLLAASAVSVAGIISFVGLIVPHIARLLVGSDYHHLFPASVLLGAVTLVACDTVGRVIILPGEMPVSVIMAFIGAPFFLYLLRRKAKKGG
jgi:iron complex transport system permease protein